ncbi:uncharacterized protein [Venturia canescens]|uniref:uncharacterized protein n=1 Tax=Venturia canescens TaxID=32260 RepID=UPI001C9BF4ED|nr:uncharacterized protein LOC122408303 [Venturia canescens]
MFENRGKFRFHNSAKWCIVIFLKCIAYLQCGETKNSSIVENSEGCGGEFSGYQYTISSPNYPKSYAEQQNCIFILRGSHLATCDQVFNLKFLDFSLPPSENCADDYVEIGDRSLFCGRVIGIREYPSKNNKLILRFRSGTRSRLGDKRFKILITTVPCFLQQMNGKNTANMVEQDGTTLGNQTADKYFTHENTGSHINLPIERNRQFVRNEVPSPPKVKGLDEKEENDLLTVTQHIEVNEAPSNYLQVPVGGIKLFRDPTLTKTETVIPNTVQSNEQKPSKISAYLFVEPNPENYFKDRTQSSISSVTFSTDSPKASLLSIPQTEIHPPNRENVQFRDTRFSNSTRKLLLRQEHQGNNEKFLISTKTYDIPDVPSYPSFQNSVPGIKTGEVLDNPSSFINYPTNTNLKSELEVTKTLHGKNREPINNLQSNQGFSRLFYPTMSYQFPSSHHASYVSPYVLNGNHATTAGITYGLPTASYTTNVPGVSEFENCKNSLPRFDVLPSNSFKGYQNFIPNVDDSVNYYPVIPNSRNIGNLPLCCNTYYLQQRFLLASPDFPSSSYSENTFECAFSIIPYSTNTCYMRFNLKFFNHGVDDSSCSNGHIEIDGRRICGCKKGLSIQSIVTTAFPKLVGVRYTGYPRTKFNGFLIEVIQEPCANSYGYQSRSKKDTGNLSIENDRSTKINIGIGNTTVKRTKRNLGYSYPKPSFGFVEGSVLGQPYIFGNSPNFHSWAHEDFVSNVLSPLFSCQVFSFLDWIIAAKETYFKNSRCVKTNTASGNNFPHTYVVDNSGFGETAYPCKNCEDINVIEGIISSPQYPTNYPNNVDKCFRFYKAPGFCQLELVVLDFYLEKSIGCTKDYMIFTGNNSRYCGNSLAGRKIMFDISRGGIINVCFVTDTFGTERGFSAGFSQIPCRGLVNR